MNTLKKAINKLINCTEEEVSTVGEGGTTGDHCYGDQWPVWAVSQPPPLPVVSTAHSLVPAAHYLPGTGWAGCGAGHCTARRCTGIQVTSNGPEMQEIMFYALRRSWALNFLKGIWRCLLLQIYKSMSVEILNPSTSMYYRDNRASWITNMEHFVELIDSIIILLFSCLIYHCHLCNNS